MKSINAHTKIARILKAHPGALDAIACIDPKLEKLRNPLLRKVLAGRTSIAMASKISGKPVSDFFDKLRELGFEIDDSVTEEKTNQSLPAFISSLGKNQIKELDVRDIIDSGGDPLNLILEKIKEVHTGEALKVINSFEPVPLIKILEKQGYEVYVDTLDDNRIETYFYKKNKGETVIDSPKVEADNAEWENSLAQFENKLVEIDVRHLEMPGPMHTILGELDHLPKGHALYVNHKRIPVFLLPELADRDFDYRVFEVEPGNVKMLIFRTE